MKVCVVGSGYVGLSVGVGLASKGHEITCVDVDEEKVRKINEGYPPLYEPSLKEMLRGVLNQGLIVATTDLERAIADSSMVFITVGTPSCDAGTMDLSMVKKSARGVGRGLRKKDDYMVIAVKSTVVPGTTENEIISGLEEESGKRAGSDFGVCMNPEFLREGTAISDFLNPDRIVIGELDERSGKKLAELYDEFEVPILRVGLKAAEMIKYASNAFLASKISFINEIGNICKKLGIDVYEVAEGIGMDHRISSKFLRAGAGYGGSCFPKDVRALIARSEEIGYSPELLRAVVSLNEDQPLNMLGLLKKHIENLEGKTIGVLGLSFKPGTDDIRESPALKVVEALLEEGAKVKAYDPKAMGNFEERFPNVGYCNRGEKVLESDATLIMTGWEEFSNLDYSGKIIIDGRRIKKAEREAHVYEGVCW